MPTVTASNAAEGLILTVLATGVMLLFALRRLQRSRPAMLIGSAMLAAFTLRLLAIIGVNATGIGASLRGGDEFTFINLAHTLAVQPIGTVDLPHGVYQLMTDMFAMEMKIGFMNATAIRVVQVGVAMLGTLFMTAAAYDLGGPKAARWTAWLLAIEPSSIFFNSGILKEPMMELAAGIVALGGVWFWKRLDIRGILICALGCLIAITTRSYAGWFMACGSIMLILHASLRSLRYSSRAVPFIYAIVLAAFIAGPTAYAATAGNNLKILQASQAANAAGIGQGGTGGPNGSNLALPPVNYSSRTAILTSLPTKIRELLLEPYPWQLHDANQAFGSVGTLFFYAMLLLFIRYAWLSRGKVFSRAGPLLYPLFFETIAYSLTVGNAGTGFRYRSHLITLGIAAVMVLRQHLLEEREAAAAARTREPIGLPTADVAPVAV
ncbi:MAG: hypothetical protein M0T77_01025 [Actinomycetota bacterium]|nr:hypothetical protein [Actinomycetota bacterium]